MVVETRLNLMVEIVNIPGLKNVPLMDPHLMNGFARLSIIMMTLLKKLEEDLSMNFNL